MYRYLMIESKEHIKLHETTILSLFSEFIKFDKVEVLKNQVWIYYQNDSDISLRDVVINLSQDTLVDFRLYQSYKFESLNQLEENRFFIEKNINDIHFNTYIFINDHIILKHNLKKLDQDFKKQILRKYHQDQMMINTVKMYLESNQNMSVSAKSLFIHRNTLIQRLEKFNQTTGFDVRKFTDGFLIYHLLLLK